MKKSFTNSCLIRVSWILTMLAVMQYPSTGQTSHAVEVSNNVFTPDHITINQGDTVIWTNVEGRHNVNGEQSKFPTNPEPFGNDVGTGWIWSYVFTAPGVYDYQCDPHASFGMIGTVTVLELPPDTLTVNFSGMTPHVGQTGFILVVDNDTGEEMERSNGTIEEAFSLVIPGIIAGHSYTIEVFADLNGNGYYDAPPVDHAWRLELNDVIGNEVVEFTHNTNFTDIEWDHRVILTLTGMTPHLGQEIYFALIDTETGEVVDRKSEIVEESFTVELSEIKPGRSYQVDFFSDHNGNGYYDLPPADHSWRLEITDATGDEYINFIHNTNFTDIMTSFGPDIQLVEDPTLGSILTDGSGYTLYYFTKDALPDTSLCTGGCVTNWPLFYVENPVLGDGLNIADFSSIVHPEGGMQTTYKGWPLYYFVNDLNPGETSGEGVGNVWFVAKPDYSIILMDGQLVGKDGVTYNSNYEPGEEMVQYFVDEYGMSLYIFVNDTYNQNNFTESDFSNDPVWPIYEEELMSVASTLDKSLFGSIDVFGRQQLTFNGWPLYYFGDDSQRGDATGVSVPSPGIWPVAVAGLEAPVVSSVDNNEAKLGLQLYPNPAINEFTISSNEIMESISIFNVMGARIHSIKSIGSKTHFMSLEGIGPGVYFVEVRSVNRNAQIRRIVKR